MSVYRTTGPLVSFLIKFEKANRIAPDGTQAYRIAPDGTQANRIFPHFVDVTSGAILFACEPLKECQAYMG